MKTKAVAAILIFFSLIPFLFPQKAESRRLTPQKELKRVLKELNRHPELPLPWYRLARYAEENHMYSGALEAAIIAKELLPNQSELRKARLKIEPVNIQEIIESAAAAQAEEIIAGRDSHSISIHLPSRGRLSLQDFRNLSKKTKLLKDIRRAYDLGATIRTPRNNTEMFNNFIKQQIALYTSIESVKGRKILENELALFESQLKIYQKAMATADDPLQVLEFIRSSPSNRFIGDARSHFARIMVKRAIEMAEREQNTRRALHELLQARQASGGEYIFNAIAREEGIDYLDDIEFVKIDTVMSHEELLGTSDFWFLGSVSKWGQYLSVAKANEMVIRDYDWVRGFVTHSNIKKRPVIRRKKARYEDEEIWGNISDFMENKKLGNQDVFTDQPPSDLPSRYTPCTLAKTSTSSSGFIGGVSDFINEHPVASALLVGSVAHLLSQNSSGESSSSSGTSKSTASTNSRNDLWISKWSRWYEHPASGSRYREANVVCPNKWSFQVEEWLKGSGEHYFKRDSGEVLLPKKYGSLKDFVVEECN